MKILRGAFGEKPAQDRTWKCVAALGTFDGVHRGHQELIRRGKNLAEAFGAKLRVCVFDRHPMEVLCPERAPQMLQTAAEQAARMEALGADELRVISFTAETARMEPEAFLRALDTECGLNAVVTGWNYTFGRGGKGNPEMIRRIGETMGFNVEIVPPVRTETGEIISSSAIRDGLRKGEIDRVNDMLGFPYEITGPVVNGKHEGSRIGFPTANIETDARKMLPAHGVYACEMSSGEEKWDAVVNIGLQPTIPSGKVTVEAHALGAEMDLYGRTASVRLLRFLRPEKRFGSIPELIDQIEQDRINAADFFEKRGVKTCQCPENPVY